MSGKVRKPRKATMGDMLGTEYVTRKFGDTEYKLSAPVMDDYSMWINRQADEQKKERREKAKAAVADLKEAGIKDEEILKDTYLDVLNGKDEEGIGAEAIVTRLLNSGFSTLEGARFWFWRMTRKYNPEVTETAANAIIGEKEAPEVFSAMNELKPEPKKESGSKKAQGEPGEKIGGK